MIDSSQPLIAAFVVLMWLAHMWAARGTLGPESPPLARWIVQTDVALMTACCLVGVIAWATSGASTLTQWARGAPFVYAVFSFGVVGIFVRGKGRAAQNADGER